MIVVSYFSQLPVCHEYIYLLLTELFGSIYFLMIRRGGKKKFLKGITIYINRQLWKFINELQSDYKQLYVLTNKLAKV